MSSGFGKSLDRSLTSPFARALPVSSNAGCCSSRYRTSFTAASIVRAWRYRGWTSIVNPRRAPRGHSLPSASVRRTAAPVRGNRAGRSVAWSGTPHSSSGTGLNRRAVVALLGAIGRRAVGRCQCLHTIVERSRRPAGLIPCARRLLVRRGRSGRPAAGVLERHQRRRDYLDASGHTRAERAARAVSTQGEPAGALGRTQRSCGDLSAENRYPAARPLLQAMHRDLQLHLKPSVPALTKRLAAGVGLAEDPGNGFSFGEHRCRVIADALIQAQEQGKSSLDDRIQVVLDVLQREGIRSDAPYLNAESSDGYDFAAPPISTPVTNRTIEPERLRPAVTATTCVETAHEIGWQICRDAHWSGSRCNWMGATSDDSGRAACEALGPYLYAGSSGVAWFLAELHAATGDPTTRKTAVGAIEQALWQSKGIAVSDRLGLFVGCSGIALAAARAGTILGEDRLLSRARELAHGLPTASDAVVQADHISGAAGAIAALLSLYHALGDDFLLEKAVALGEILVERAVRTTRHWSWTTTNERGEANLTGFSHGAAGIGCALMDLSRAARDAATVRPPSVGSTTSAAGSCRRHGTGRTCGGVPRRGGRRHAPPGSHVWCHGAPGIALSRLRAFEITSEPRWKHEAVIALETTYTLTEPRCMRAA